MFFLFWLSKTLVINFLFKFFLQPSHHHHPLHERIVPFSHLISSQIIHSPIPFPSFPRPYFLITTNLHRHHCLPSHRHHPPPSAHHPPYTSFDPLIFIIIITITLVYQILFSILSKHKKKKKNYDPLACLFFFLFVIGFLFSVSCVLLHSTDHTHSSILNNHSHRAILSEFIHHRYPLALFIIPFFLSLNIFLFPHFTHSIISIHFLDLDRILCLAYF